MLHLARVAASLGAISKASWKLHIDCTLAFMMSLEREHTWAHEDKSGLFTSYWCGKIAHDHIALLKKPIALIFTSKTHSRLRLMKLHLQRKETLQSQEIGPFFYHQSQLSETRLNYYKSLSLSIVT